MRWSQRFSPYSLHYLSVHPRNTSGEGVFDAATAASTATAAAATHSGGDSGGGGDGSMCALELRVRATSSSSGHKFKLTALFVSKSDRGYFGDWIFNKAMEGKQLDARTREVSTEARGRGRSRAVVRARRASKRPAGG